LVQKLYGKLQHPTRIRQYKQVVDYLINKNKDLKIQNQINFPTLNQTA
jgi:hypothetical protein